MKPPSTPGDDRRVHRRHELRLSAELRTPSRHYAAATRDLSEGGCCIEAPYPLPEGSEIALALFLVVDDVEEALLPQLECTATVQWCAVNDEAPVATRHLAGLRFLDLSDAQRAWVKRFLPPA